MVENNEIVWEKVCAMQESAGLTVADISARSGVPLTTVKRYFKGETKNPGFFPGLPDHPRTGRICG